MSDKPPQETAGELSGADILVQALTELGVEFVFG